MEQYLKSCKTDFWKDVFKAELEYILQQLKGTTDILSVGCGPAIIEAGLAEHGFNITGLDISQEALDQAPDSIRTIAGPAEEMDFEKGSFDAVIYIVSLQFIENYKKAVKQTVRVLKTGGKILVLLLNPKSGFFRQKTSDPSSYINRIRHIDLTDIEKTIEEYFFTETEYFLGIEDKKVFQSSDAGLASLYVIKGTKK
jgi:ubiquinone/menaquinone biosynthesis C-methylase UbiE